jgi:predicted nucleic acid-binding protein
MFAAALFHDEQHPLALSVYELILGGEEIAKVPPMFLYEACNVVLNGIRRKRITEKIKQDYMQLIFDFPVEVDNNQSMQDVVKTASKHGLTIYDASYLELAIRQSLPLATFDRELIAAAKKEKVTVITAAIN